MDETDIDDIGYDRPGFLTKKDRQWLQEQPDDGDYSEKRRRIRQRTQSAFQDFSLLFEQLSKRDRRLIFEDYDDRPPWPWQLSSRDQGMYEGITSMFAFVCLGIADHWPPRHVRNSGHRIEKFHGVIEEAFRKAYPELGLIFYSADIDIQSADEETVDDLKKQIERGSSEVNGVQMRTLIEAGEIDMGRLGEFVEDEISECE